MSQSVVASTVGVPAESDLQRIISQGITLWRQNRDHYRPLSDVLPTAKHCLLRPFFSTRLLDQIRYVQLGSERLRLPLDEIRKFADVPAIEHQHGVTFIDTLVLNEQATERQWFHSLVHATQMDVLGLESYIDLYVHALARTRAYVKVPFEVQAFCLDTRFAASPSRCFSVAEEVRLWAAERRY